MLYEAVLKNRNMEIKERPELTSSAQHFVKCAIAVANARGCS